MLSSVARTVIAASVGSAVPVKACKDSAGFAVPRCEVVGCAATKMLQVAICSGRVFFDPSNQTCVAVGGGVGTGLASESETKQFMAARI